jgi:peptide/nickel transport system permease protein
MTLDAGRKETEDLFSASLVYKASAGHTVSGPLHSFWGRLRTNRLALIGGMCLLGILLIALLAPVIAKLTGHSPNATHVDTELNSFGIPLGPSSSFLFGADTLGRDQLVRIAYGARYALLVGFLATAVSLTIGLVVGTVCGFFRGLIDLLLSRVIDLFLVLPVLLLALGLSASCGGVHGCAGGSIKPGLTLVVAVIGLTNWAYVARVVRGEVLSLREREFVEAARALGGGPVKILATEVIPNVVSSVIVLGLILFPSSILYEAALNFLGVGVTNTPSWGAMLSQAGNLLPAAWWMLVFPALFLSLTVLSLSLLGEGVRDALDPREGRNG